MGNQRPAAPIEETTELRLRFDASGLIPAIAQDHETREVLMVAWMNAEAFELTRASGKVHFYSRSRKRIWMKGEESGNFLLVRDILVDCDQDTVLLRVRIGGDAVACHTGRASCFYRRLDKGSALVRL